MEVVVQAIASLIAFPLQTLLVVAGLVIFIYWFVKERPKEREATAKMEKDRNTVMTNFVDVMNEYKVQIAQNVTNYDKLTDYSVRVVENNTIVLQSILHNVESLVKNVAIQLQQAESNKLVHKAHDDEMLKRLHEIEIALAKLLERQ